MRVVYLSSKPLHHDEGVNGNFLTTLFRTGFYRYDPTNYHGPSLYYFGLITTAINALLYGKAGLSTFAIRLVPAMFGVGAVWLALHLRRQIGRYGCIAAAALLATSPGQVFFSRYFIHEILVVFFTLSLILATVRYEMTARPAYLVLTAAAAAFLGTTKETWLITIAVLIAAYATARLYAGIRKTWPDWTLIREELHLFKSKDDNVLKHEINPEVNQWRWVVAAATVFVAIWILLYSSFFTNFPAGLYDSMLSFKTWSRAGTNDFVSPWSTYLKWLCQEEFPCLLLGFVGIVLALWEGTNRFAMFLAFWALGITAAYSAIPYKTP